MTRPDRLQWWAPKLLALTVALVAACSSSKGTQGAQKEYPPGPPGSPQALHAAASSACARMPLRSTGTIHYFCDCQTGREDACQAGSDDGASASDNALDCTDAAAPCRTFAQANVTFNRMPGGDTIAFCKGGAFEQAGSTTWANTRCAPAADLRAAANTTTCDIRDYAPPTWTGTNKPIIRQTTQVANLFQFWDAWTHGIRILNLDLEGGGTGCGGAILGRAALESASASQVLVCNDTISWWMVGGNNEAMDNPASADWDYYGNTFVGNSLDAVLGGGDRYTYDANDFVDNGSCTATSHVIYPAGSNSAQVENVDLKIVNNWIRFVNATCQGPMINGHGTYDGVVIENNLIQTIGTSNGGCWGIGIAPDNGYNHVVQYEKNMFIRRNRVEGAGWHLISCSSCPGVVVEDNVLVSSAPETMRGIMIAVPSAPARTIQPDPITTGAVIRSNTIYVQPSGSAVMTAFGPGTDGMAPEGTGYVFANNAVAMPAGGFCWATPWPDDRYTVSNNACFGGTWDDSPASSPVTADPLFVDAPADFTPAASSPLAGAGAAAYAPAYDFDLTSRPSPPSIGAYER